MMNPADTRSCSTRIRRRRVGRLFTSVILLILASSGVALAATGLARARHAAEQIAPPSATINPASNYWQPPGCVFPPANAFPRH